MDINNILAISGMPGLFKMIGNRNNGLIVEGMEDGKKKFVPSRKHQFTPLESVAIYTLTDTEELPNILKTMKDTLAENPLPDPKASKEILHEYFGKILPTFDRDRVHARDIGKVIKWFSFLNERGLLNEDEASSSEEE